MNTTCTNLILTIAAITATSQSALAETGQAPPPSQEAVSLQATNESASLEKPPQFNTNLTVNPFFFLFAGVSVAASFRVDESLAIGPTFSTLSFAGFSVTTGGVQGQYHLKKKDVMGEGLILHSSLELERSTTEIFGFSSTVSALMATSSVNWQWVYPSGFNFRLGAGVGLHAFFGNFEIESVSGPGAKLGDRLAANAFIDARAAWAF